MAKVGTSNQDRTISLNPLNAELNPICYLLALLGAHHFLHVSRIRVKVAVRKLKIIIVNIANNNELRANRLTSGNVCYLRSRMFCFPVCYPKTKDYNVHK